MNTKHRPFLRWPSVKDCAAELGVPENYVFKWRAGKSRPKDPRVLAVLAGAGWTPPPAKARDHAEAPGLPPPLPPEKVLPPTQDVLRRAAERPEGCSEARWRMELARRRRGHGVRLDPDDI